MSLANIVLADAQATPVNHTFEPRGRDANGVEWLTDYSQANAVGYWQISIQTTQPAAARAGESSQGRTFRIKVGLHEPVLETLGTASQSGILPAPTVAYIPRSFIEYVVPERSVPLDRSSLAKMTAGLADNAQIKDFVTKLTQVRS